MLINYYYKDQSYCLEINWTEDGYSTAFQNIQKTLSSRHKINSSIYEDMSMNLDHLMDRLYKQLYSLPENYSNTYNPAYTRLVEEILEEIHIDISSLSHVGESGIIYFLYSNLFDKIREIVDVFYDDNRYQNKMLKHHETSIEITCEIHCYRIRGFTFTKNRMF